MNKPLLLFLLFMLAAPSHAQPARANADDSAALKRQAALLEKQLELARREAAALKAENAELKRENAAMKRELAMQPKLRVLPGAEEQGKPATAGFWITSSTGKRHNSACRYFQGKNGRACGPREGEPCKLCGG